MNSMPHNFTGRHPRGGLEAQFAIAAMRPFDRMHTRLCRWRCSRALERKHITLEQVLAARSEP